MCPGKPAVPLDDDAWLATASDWRSTTSSVVTECDARPYLAAATEVACAEGFDIRTLFELKGALCVVGEGDNGNPGPDPEADEGDEIANIDPLAYLLGLAAFGLTDLIGLGRYVDGNMALVT